MCTFGHTPKGERCARIGDLQTKIRIYFGLEPLALEVGRGTFIHDFNRTEILVHNFVGSKLMADCGGEAPQMPRDMEVSK